MAVPSTSPSVPDHIQEGGNIYSHSQRTANIEILRSCPMTDTGSSGDELSCFATNELSEVVLSLHLPGGSEKNHENAQSGKLLPITRLELL